jgi:hypothetical protein
MYSNMPESWHKLITLTERQEAEQREPSADEAAWLMEEFGIAWDRVHSFEIVRHAVVTEVIGRSGAIVGTSCTSGHMELRWHLVERS